MSDTFTSRVTVTRPPALDLDPDGVLQATAGVVVYSGPARLGSASGPVTYTVGEEVQFYSSSSCTIPMLDVNGEPTDVSVNDQVRVDAADDPNMAGRVFRVIDVEAAGLMAVGRRLQLVGVQHYPGWVDDVVRHPSSGEAPDVVPPEWLV
jgi:hypothetical protein